MNTTIENIKNAINVLERYMKFQCYDERFPEDEETSYIISKLKVTQKCNNCVRWGSAFKTVNACQLGITDGEHIQAYVSHKELQKKNGEEQIQYCLEKTGKDWNEIEERFKYGILIKKELYKIPDNDPRAEYNEGFVTRSRLVQTSIPMNSFSLELVELISRQYIN